MAYDPSDGYLLLFGGTSASLVQVGDTWTYTPTAHWIRPHLNGTTPSVRGLGVLAYDSRNRSVELFGGYFYSAITGQFAPYSDVWRFVAGAGARVSTSPAVGPTGREDAGFVDDVPAGRMVLFGGADMLLAATFDDTWAYSNGTWSILAGAAAPTSRTGAVLAYDAATRSVLLFGGSDLNETWSYSGGNWTQVAVGSGPPGRISPSMAFDVNDSEMVLFGGETFINSRAVLLNETWVYANGNWTNITATAHGPPARAASTLAYDPGRSAVVLFGGASFTGYWGDTWAFAAGRWTNLTPSVGPGPIAREFPQLAYDGADHYLLLFGGVNTLARGTPCTGGCNDTWLLGASNWTRIVVSGSPPGRYAEGLGYDPILGSVVLFGGMGSVRTLRGSTLANFADSWEYVGGLWSNVTATFGAAPPPATTPGTTGGSTSAYDGADGSLFDFSGSLPYSSWWQLAAKSANPLTVGVPTAAPNPLALGGNVTINATASGGFGPYGYTWTGLPSGCSPRDSASLTCRPTASASYLVRVTVSDTAGEVVPSASLALVVGPAFSTLSISPTSGSIVPFGSWLLTAEPVLSDGSSPTGGVSYAWSVAPAGIGYLSSTVGSAVSFNAGSANGTTAVFLNATYEGTTRAAQATIVIAAAVAPLKITSFTTAVSVIQSVGEVNVSVNVTGGVPPYSYYYSGLPSECLSAGNVSSFTCSFPAGTWPITVEVTDAARHTANDSTIVLIPWPSFHTQVASGGWWLWGAVGVGIVALAAAAVVLILRRRPPTRPPAGRPAEPSGRS